MDLTGLTRIGLLVSELRAISGLAILGFPGVVVVIMNWRTTFACDHSCLCLHHEMMASVYLNCIEIRR